jgi:hypothetical protein
VPGTVAHSHLSLSATFHYTCRIRVVNVVPNISFPWEMTIPRLRVHFLNSVHVLRLVDHKVHFLFSSGFGFHDDHIRFLRIQVWDICCRVDENLRDIENPNVDIIQTL